MKTDFLWALNVNIEFLWKTFVASKYKNQCKEGINKTNCHESLRILYLIMTTPRSTASRELLQHVILSASTCVQREEKDFFLKPLSGLSAGKRQSGTLAEVASAFSLLLLTPDDWIPTSFLCLLGILFPGFCQFLFAGMSRYVAERKQREVWWMLQMKWNLVFGWCSPQYPQPGLNGMSPGGPLG